MINALPDRPKYKPVDITSIADNILLFQKDNGGWPQYYPIVKRDYSTHITFNDGALEGIISVPKDIKDDKPQYAFLGKKLCDQLMAAYDKAIPCILKMQINDAGKPTAWCQQYDEVTLEAAWARKFEPSGICSGGDDNV